VHEGVLKAPKFASGSISERRMPRPSHVNKHSKSQGKRKSTIPISRRFEDPSQSYAYQPDHEISAVDDIVGSDEELSGTFYTLRLLSPF